MTTAELREYVARRSDGVAICITDANDKLMAIQQDLTIYAANDDDLPEGIIHRVSRLREQLNDIAQDLCWFARMVK